MPACFSTISWEIRIVARRMSSPAMMRRPVIGRTCGVARARSSFPASRGHPASRDRHGNRGEVYRARALAAGRTPGDQYTETVTLVVPDELEQPQILKKSGRYMSTTRPAFAGP